MRAGGVSFQPIARAFRRGRVPQAGILAQLGEEFVTQQGAYLPLGRRHHPLFAGRTAGSLNAADRTAGCSGPHQPSTSITSVAIISVSFTRAVRTSLILETSYLFR